MRRLLFLSVFVLVLALSGCGQQATPTVESVAPASLQAGEPVPIPTGEVVLTLSGNISNTNVDDTLAFDMATLEKVGLVSHTVKDDPFAHAEVTYTGVLLSDLMKVAGAPESATSVHMVALNDYEVDIDLADTRRWPVLVTTRLNGEFMPVDNYGPTWLVFPYDFVPTAEKTKYLDLSIWNLIVMEIR